MDNCIYCFGLKISSGDAAEYEAVSSDRVVSGMQLPASSMVESTDFISICVQVSRGISLFAEVQIF